MRRLVPLVAFALVSFTLAACAGDGGGGGVRAENALARTKAAKTVAYALTVAVTSQAEQPSTTGTVPNAVELRVEGVWDMKENLVRSTVKYKTPEAEDSAQYRVLGPTIYVKGSQAKDGKWKKFDGPDGGVGTDTLGVLRPDPALEILAGLTGTSKKVGEERIGGVATTRFQGKADLKRAVARAEADAKDAVQARLDNTDGTSADIDMWLDEDGRIRRLITSTKGKGAQAGYRTTIDFTRFGVKVDVKAPPAAEISTDG